MREEDNRVIDASRPLSRRNFALLEAAGLLAAGFGAATQTAVSAREAERGDDRGGHRHDDRRRHHRREDRRRRRHN